MTNTDPRTRRTLAQLDQVHELLPGVMRTLNAISEHVRQMVTDLSMTYDDWQAMTIEQRGQIQVRHADEVTAKVRQHVGLPLRAWVALSFDEKWDLIDKWRAEVRDAE